MDSKHATLSDLPSSTTGALMRVYSRPNSTLAARISFKAGCRVGGDSLVQTWWDVVVASMHVEVGDPKPIHERHITHQNYSSKALQVFHLLIARHVK